MEWIEAQVVSANPVRLDSWLSSHFPEVSRSRWQKAIREERVVRSEKDLVPRVMVSDGDILSIDAQVFNDNSNHPKIPEPQDLPLTILFEDEDILVINKASGMVVHPGNGCENGTVVNAALHHTHGKLAALDEVERPGIVHRLDKETSGVLILGKTEKAARDLFSQFQARSISKTYICVVQGVPDQQVGTCDGPIGRHPVNRTKMAVLPDGRPAVSHWEVLNGSNDGWSALRVSIETGRTHQIRVHLSEMGFPVLGDSLYGFRKTRVSGDAARVERILLHSFETVFRHPVSGKVLEVQAHLPSEMTTFIS